MSHQSTAIFLGAGASAEFGYPVTSKILPKVIEQWADNGTLFDETNGKERDREDRKKLRTYVTALLPGLSQTSNDDLPLITDVFSLVDHAVANGSAFSPRLSSRELGRFSLLLKQAIFDVLIENWLNDYTDSELEIEQNLGGWLRSLNCPAIVSTNYDTSADEILFHQFFKDCEEDILAGLDFGFAWRDPYVDVIHERPVAPKARLYKLHGSLNRLRCPLCRSAYVNIDGTIAHQAFLAEVADGNTCWCEHARLDIDLVAPSLVRSMRDPHLIQIWQNAFDVLHQASEWIIIGYSLPSEDLMIRDLLIRAYLARKKPPHVTIVQHSEKAHAQYALLFRNCEYRADGMGTFLDQVCSHT